MINAKLLMSILLIGFPAIAASQQTTQPAQLTEWGSIAQWASVTATFCAVLVALFKDSVVRWLRKPELVVSMQPKQPDCTKAILLKEFNNVIIRTDCYFFRVLVLNKGKTRAEKVQVFASALTKLEPNGIFQDVPNFLPMNLRWAHDNVIFAEGISYKWESIVMSRML